jgi:hypothetical protein
MLPTTGFVGGCGIGAKRLPDAIAGVSPAIPYTIIASQRVGRMPAR